MLHTVAPCNCWLYFTLNTGLGWYCNVQGEQRQLTASSHMVTVKTMQALMMTAATPLCLKLTQTMCLKVWRPPAETTRNACLTMPRHKTWTLQCPQWVRWKTRRSWERSSVSITTLYMQPLSLPPVYYHGKHCVSAIRSTGAVPPKIVGPNTIRVTAGERVTEKFESNGTLSLQVSSMIILNLLLWHHLCLLSLQPLYHHIWSAW